MKIENSKLKINFGFTLAELVVSMAIISIMAAVLLGNRNQYSERLILKNETYNTVLYLRQAQVYSLGVKAGGSPAIFNTSYGALFNMAESNQFKFFTDANFDGKFQTSEINNNISLKDGVVLQKVCMAATCSPGSLSKIAVTFKRPNSAAILKGLNSSDDDLGLSPPTAIYLISKTGLISTIKVDTSGGISIIGI
ncbi:MAG: type II secretion system protein [Patescibacteria group bacterium]